MGVIIALFMALGYGALARIGVMKNWSKKIYDHSEDNILYFIKKYSHLIKLLRGAPVGDTAYNSLRIESREEFQHLVTESDSVLTSDERKMIVNNLTFSDQLVKTIMTPRNMIVSISKTEFLGPLVLNDLHKVGHSRLPVIDKDIDHIVGILNLKTLLTLDIKKSATAEKVMDLKVYYIREDQTLHHALVALLHTHHHLLIVVDESRETVGILALEDIIEALLGRKIVDDFNDHDNIHAVVSRKNI
jgi:CBS domain containing-hemolysin-like protein